MTTDKIKTRLSNTLQDTMNTSVLLMGFWWFQSFEFITTEPKIKNVLKDQFNYYEQQMNIALNIPKLRSPNICKIELHLI